VSFVHNSRFKLQNAERPLKGANCSSSLVDGLKPDKGGVDPDLSALAERRIYAL